MAILVVVICLLLLLFMRTVGALTGSSSCGTLAGCGLVSLPLIVIGAVAMVGFLFSFGWIAAALLLLFGIIGLNARLSRK